MKNIKLSDVAKAIILMEKGIDFQMKDKKKKITFLSGILIKEEDNKFYVFSDVKHTWIEYDKDIFSERRKEIE